MIKYLILLFSISLVASNNNKLFERLSPLSENLYLDLESKSLDTSNYLIKSFDGKPSIGALIVSNRKIDESVFKKYSLIKGARIDSFYSVKISLDNYIEFCNRDFIKYLEINEPVGLYLDSANSSANYLDAGLDFRNSEFFLSDGVVVGVIDVGFQFGHQMFNNSSGNSRIKKAWLQGFASTSRPQNFNYGTEITPIDYNRYETDDRFDSHGSHVAGIAAGRQYLGTRFEGVASEADIVFVSPNFYEDQLQNTSQTDLIDGIDYIFREADRLGKPCVINMSLGNQIGPHDGNSVFDQMAGAILNRSNFGKSLVTAAGNDGDVRMNISQDFKQDPDTLRTMFNLYIDSETGNGIRHYLDLWGEPGEQICVSMGIQGSNGIEWDDRVFCTDQSGNSSAALSRDGNFFSYQISVSPIELMNGKPRVFVSLLPSGNSVRAAIKVHSTGKIHLWNCFAGGSTADDFYSLGANGYKRGSLEYQIGEIGGNSDDFITVAAHNTKSRVVNVRNNLISNGEQVGDVASFSSNGPTAEDQLKPDISAPGSMIVSAYNKFDNRLDINSTQTGITHISNLNNDLLGINSGTSMSAPIVAGVVALMFRANPFLDHKQVKSILMESAYEDLFTGNISQDGSITWGFGKVDAYEAVRRAEEEASMIELFPEILIGPNPFDDRIKITFGNTPTNKRRFVFADRLGKIISEGEIPLNNDSFELELNTSTLAQGVYYLSLETDRFEKGYVLIKLKE